MVPSECASIIAPSIVGQHRTNTPHPILTRHKWFSILDIPNTTIVVLPNTTKSLWANKIKRRQIYLPGQFLLIWKDAKRHNGCAGHLSTTHGEGSLWHGSLSSHSLPGWPLGGQTQSVAGQMPILSPKVKYVGHIVSETGIATDPVKVEVVKPCKEPTDLKSLRSFLVSVATIVDSSPINPI